MKKKIATKLRRLAQLLDPQKPEITGYARKVIDFVPYHGLETLRDLVMAGEEEKARIVKARVRRFAEVSALACAAENLDSNGIIRLEHNMSHEAKIIDGIRCEAEGVTVIVELKGSWV